MVWLLHFNSYSKIFLYIKSYLNYIVFSPIQGLYRSMEHAFVIPGGHVFWTVHAIYLVLFSVAFPIFGSSGGLLYHKVYTHHLPQWASAHRFLIHKVRSPTTWLFGCNYLGIYPYLKDLCISTIYLIEVLMARFSTVFRVIPVVQPKIPNP